MPAGKPASQSADKTLVPGQELGSFTMEKIICAVVRLAARIVEAARGIRSRPGDGEDAGRISLAAALDSDAFAAILCARLPNRRRRADAQGNFWNHFDRFDLDAFFSQVFTNVSCHVGKSWLAIVG